MEYVRLTREQKKQEFLSSLALREEIKARKIPFIHPNFLPNFWLSQGLILVGAESGRAKSTTCSNIIAGFLNSSKRDVIVITNEESADAILTRTACILLKKSYLDFFNDVMSPFDQGIIIEAAAEISQRVEVVEGNEQNRTDTIEGVVAVLETAAADGNVGLVCCDYHQTITSSLDYPDWEAFRVSKELGTYFRDYGKRYGVPVVNLVQLRPSSEGSNMSERIMNDRTLLTHAFVAIEVQPDFNAQTVTFTIAKDRFMGCTGKKQTLDFSGGRLVMQGQTREELRNG